MYQLLRFKLHSLLITQVILKPCYLNHEEASKFCFYFIYYFTWFIYICTILCVFFPLPFSFNFKVNLNLIYKILHKGIYFIMIYIIYSFKKKTNEK